MACQSREEAKSVYTPPRPQHPPMAPPATELERRFRKAVWLVRNGPPAKSSNEKKLQFYSLFKQATEGDVKGDQPWAVQVRKKEKATAAA